MDFLKKFAERIISAGKEDPNAYWIHVQCDHCNEKLRTRVDLRNDLSVQYGERDQDNSYLCRKTLIGSERCFKPIEVELVFDAQRTLIDKQISGGRFITEEEYIELQE
jgi:hypothetical protein